MKWIHKEKDLEFETNNKNLFSMLEREGYKPIVKHKEKADKEKEE